MIFPAGNGSRSHPLPIIHFLQSVSIEFRAPRWATVCISIAPVYNGDMHDTGASDRFPARRSPAASPRRGIIRLLVAVFAFAAGGFSPAGAAQPARVNCDVCVVGGGSGGFGAALAAAREGAAVVVVERQPILGGTSTSALVCNWEPGPGCSFAREVYERLKAEPGAVAVARRTHRYTKEEPYGMAVGRKGSGLSYADTLRRSGRPHARWCSVVFRWDAMAAAMHAMLRDAGAAVLLNTTFVSAAAGTGTVRHITAVDNTGKNTIIAAKVFIDATGGVHLCRAAGCETMLGEESRDRFGEPSAPKRPGDFLNAVSLCYLVRRGGSPEDPGPRAAPRVRFPRTAFVSGVGAGELVVNPLPLVAGNYLVEHGYEKTMELARKRVRAHWRWLRKYPHFRGYEMVRVAPMPGIRESRRVVAEYILTERDVRAGFAKQDHPDMVALADHALDIHGGGHGAKELKRPYGIPYRCLIPKGWKNLLAACRGAGFSHIAASSCRLSRTMIALGHAAGIAAAEAARKDIDVRDIAVSRLVRRMGLRGKKTERAE